MNRRTEPPHDPVVVIQWRRREPGKDQRIGWVPFGHLPRSRALRLLANREKTDRTWEYRIKP